MTNSDLGRILKSDEIQNSIRRPKTHGLRKIIKKNPLKNQAIMTRLNPYSDVTRRTAILETKLNTYKRQAAIAKRRGVSTTTLYLGCINFCCVLKQAMGLKIESPVVYGPLVN
jgi:hypothetical protein